MAIVTKRNLKIISILLILLLFASVIAGCGSNSSKKKNIPAASSNTTQTNTENKITPAPAPTPNPQPTPAPNPTPNDKLISSGNVYVRGYYRKNGTYVQPHYRTKPDGYKSNNWSTKGNYNPYTGKKGYK